MNEDSPKVVNQDLLKDMHDYAWNYFAVHAEQRLKTFNFYLLLVTVVLGGLLAYLKDSKTPALAFPVGLLLALLSFVFWKLDRRNRELIRHAEGALRTIEDARDVPVGTVPENLKLIGQEENKTTAIRDIGKVTSNPLTWWTGHYSYSDCFGVLFSVFGLLGVTIAVGVFFLAPSAAPPPAPIPQQQFFIGGQPASPLPKP